MDFDLLVFLLIFLVAPLLRRLFESRKRPQPADMEASPKPSPEAARDPLAEALRQMREALGEPPAPLPQNPPPVTLPARQAEHEFHSLGRFEHDAHGFGRENPASEEVFEQRPAFTTRGTTERIRRDALSEVDLTTPLEVVAVDPSARPDLARQLRDPQRAREAFVLKEILGPPRSRRRR